MRSLWKQFSDAIRSALCDPWMQSDVSFLKWSLANAMLRSNQIFQSDLLFQTEWSLPNAMLRYKKFSFFNAMMPCEWDPLMQSNLPGESNQPMHQDLSFFQAISSECNKADIIRYPFFEGTIPCKWDPLIQSDLPFLTRRSLVNAIERYNQICLEGAIKRYTKISLFWRNP